ncbi:hypothetical protein [Halobacillus sp. A5]|uniref:hypothetical protein n=1 Tax=Halobacillus sp. A5 TaxID=2880263 RepID=UPI0020A628BE|nr:hypothetical protein [Halobacillus sp. A5]MCP3028674.1 hypothetical protein [Halobacillus sp. A5]
MHGHTYDEDFAKKFVEEIKAYVSDLEYTKSALNRFVEIEKAVIFGSCSLGGLMWILLCMERM